jgi:hypothetical protein
MSDIRIPAQIINIIYPVHVGGTNTKQGPVIMEIKIIRSCIYNKEGARYEIISDKNNTYWWDSQIDETFEKQFCYFPYCSDRQGQIMNKLNQLEERLDKLENILSYMTSHMETFLVSVGERAANEAPLDI